MSAHSVQQRSQGVCSAPLAPFLGSPRPGAVRSDSSAPTASRPLTRSLGRRRQAALADAAELRKKRRERLESQAEGAKEKGVKKVVSRVRRSSVEMVAAGLAKVAAAAAVKDDDASADGGGADAAQARKEGVMRRMRRASVQAVANLAKTVSSTKLERELPCRFAPCGCTHVARGEKALAQHYAEAEGHHTELVRASIAQLRSQNEALRTRLARGAAAQKAVVGAIAHAEVAARASTAKLKRLRRELSQEAEVTRSNAALTGKRLEVRLEKLARQPPGMEGMDAAAEKAKDVVATLNKSADPYKRQLCGVCGCVFTELANQVPSCTRHTGEEDALGRWSCCEKPFTGLHYNGCAVLPHTAEPLEPAADKAAAPVPALALGPSTNTSLCPPASVDGKGRSQGADSGGEKAAGRRRPPAPAVTAAHAAALCKSVLGEA